VTCCKLVLVKAWRRLNMPPPSLVVTFSGTSSRSPMVEKWEPARSDRGNVSQAIGVASLDSGEWADLAEIGALEDMTDYSHLDSKMRIAPEKIPAASSPSASSETHQTSPRKPWWRLW
jgi:hypothetical protein